MELEEVRCDPVPRKPQVGVTHYLVDLRVEVNKPQWLFIGVVSLPTRLNNVNVDDDGRWWFDGVPARRLNEGRTSLTQLPVTTSDGPELVAIGSIFVDGKPPEEWIAPGDTDRADLRELHGSESAIVDVDVECAQWLEIRSDEPCLN